MKKLLFCFIVLASFWSCQKTQPVTEVPIKIVASSTAPVASLAADFSISDQELKNALEIHDRVMLQILNHEIIPDANGHLASGVATNVISEMNITENVALITDVIAEHEAEYGGLTPVQANTKMLHDSLISSAQFAVLSNIEAFMSTADNESLASFLANCDYAQAQYVTNNPTLSENEKGIINMYLKVCKNSAQLYYSLPNGGENPNRSCAGGSCKKCLKSNIFYIVAGDAAGAIAGIGACLLLPPACIALLPALMAVGSGASILMFCSCCI